jgi:phage tail protein X
MATTLRTKEGDRLDVLCYQVYKTTRTTVEIVLTENPHLADYGALLPEGLLITFPTLNQKPALQKTLQLWD